MQGQTIASRNPVKICEYCQEPFRKDPRNTWEYWERAKFCSRKCCGLMNTKLANENRKPIGEVFEKWFSKKEGCWEWQGARDRDGYGSFSYAGKTYRAHSMALTLDGRKVPEGHYACHHCDNPACVNPDHLYVGTPQQNVDDKVARGRQLKGEEVHCAKITKADVVQIRQSNASDQELAEKFSVSESNISHIRANKTWRHV